jgi:hypothetical protein
LRSRAYRHLGVNWTEFCQLYVGMSASRILVDSRNEWHVARQRRADSG